MKSESKTEVVGMYLCDECGGWHVTGHPDIQDDYTFLNLEMAAQEIYLLETEDQDYETEGE